MISLLPSIGRFPGLYQWRRRRACRAFFGTGGDMFWGEFPTSDAARQAAPPSVASCYRNPNLVSLNEDAFKEIHLFDWPVLFYLQKFMAERRIESLIDFGGHVGVKYYAFRDRLGLSASFRWQVVDTPPMVEAGTRQATESQVHNLVFFDSLAAAEPSPVLLCSGVLQYTEESVDDLLSGLRLLPDIVILNKLPLCEAGGFYTLENFGEVKLVHRIIEPEEHAIRFERMGYRRLSQWPIPYRDFSIPLSQPQKLVKMVGEVWVRSNSSPRPDR